MLYNIIKHACVAHRNVQLPFRDRH